MALVSAFAGPGLAAQPDAADALAQKFIDLPAQEADSVEERAKEYRRQRAAAARAARERAEAELRRHAAEREARERQRAGWDSKLDALMEKLRRRRQANPPEPASRDHAEAPPHNVIVPPLDHRRALPLAPRREKRHAGHARPTPPAIKVVQPRKVTILMVMRARRPRRRGVDSALDPVLCTGGRCYVSRGASRNAREMPRVAALGPFNSLGRRAGACKRSPACIFRRVDLAAASAEIQPVDLGWLRHDRRNTVRVTADPSCRLIHKRLSCRAAVDSGDYRMWIVPEDIARRAGPAALTEALRSGLRAIQQQAALHGAAAR